MSRIPLTPGVKESVRDNVGRLVAGSWTTYVNAEGDETGYYAVSIPQAVDLALGIERAVTEALTPTDED